ncbi:unnamed protein product [Paramecium pentaurelia]|uniref:START domain-containing protein n=1 Tax=Paramecium pentaurelia TaxID=43138 RepID=A0A8S1Y7N7_9CILI|nr:unnamed protein product [Paramecium pentaurelia]
MENSYLAQLDQIQEQAIQMAFQQPQEGQWTKEHDKNDCIIYSKLNQVGLKMTRTELKVNVDPKKAMDIIFDMTKRSEFDENFLEAKIVEKIDENNVIYYGAGKSPIILVDPRDMVALTRRTILKDGTHMVVSKSVQLDSVPNKKNYIRCEIFISAFLIKEISQGICQVIIIANVDPKGSIPKMLINSGVSMQADAVKKLMEKMRLQTLKV